jgi:hypothetical protein
VLPPEVVVPPPPVVAGGVDEIIALENINPTTRIPIRPHTPKNITDLSLNPMCV